MVPNRFWLQPGTYTQEVCKYFNMNKTQNNVPDTFTCQIAARANRMPVPRKNGLRYVPNAPATWLCYRNSPRYFFSRLDKAEVNIEIIMFTSPWHGRPYLVPYLPERIWSRQPSFFNILEFGVMRTSVSAQILTFANDTCDLTFSSSHENLA